MKRVQLEEKLFGITREICEQERLLRVAEEAERQIMKLRKELVQVSEEYIREAMRHENLFVRG